MTSLSYRKSLCCHGQDCDLLGRRENEPCWGRVVLDSPGDDEDGCPVAGHLCQGHRNAYEWSDWSVSKEYFPEPEEEL